MNVNDLLPFQIKLYFKFHRYLKLKNAKFIPSLFSDCRSFRQCQCVVRYFHQRSLYATVLYRCITLQNMFKNIHIMNKGPHDSKQLAGILQTFRQRHSQASWCKSLFEEPLRYCVDRSCTLLPDTFKAPTGAKNLENFTFS